MNGNIPDEIKKLAKTAKLPLVLGVTGHRNLVKGDYCAIFDEIKRNFEEITAVLAQNTEQPPILLLTGLAQGGDMLAAKVARELKIPYVAVLPCSLEEFKKSFDDAEALSELDDYIAKAHEVLIVPDLEKDFANQPNQTVENYRYRQVGVYLVQNSSLLLALWDGNPPKTQFGCGTADVVTLARNADLPVLWLPCPRANSTIE